MSLAGDPTGFENEAASGPLGLDALHIEHGCPFHADTGKTSHGQDGRKLSPTTGKASSDPAMAPLVIRVLLERRPYCRRSIEFYASLRGAPPRCGKVALPPAREGEPQLSPQSQTSDQRLISSGVDLLQVVEQSAPGADQLQEATAGMVVLDVGLEVLGQVGDPFGE